ncbi:MAG TPA: hypothetical protein VJH92_01410 [Candidatus Nanoarchaeia archaeon]|nr:hypothetical protein [Candidatus Nanoarchaeia archaeon]
MLNNDTINRIEDFIYQKPRSIQEIAVFINKNWRTADRYVDQIKKDHGTLETRTFREGTRGALKIVYWASMEKRNQTIFQEELEKRIFNAKKKEEFSCLDIFQHVPDKNKKAYVKNAKDEVAVGKLNEFRDLLLGVKNNIMFFSGNLSFINYNDGKINIYEILDSLAKRGVKMKAICRVDIAGKDNIEKLLFLNHKYGKEIVEIRHREQPLRITLVDSKMFNMKDIIIPSSREKELNKKLYVFYTVKDKAWSEWLAGIFSRMFNNSIGAEKRLEEINKLLKKNKLD